MISIIKHISYITTLLLGGILTGSCASQPEDEESVSCYPGSGIYVTLSISATSQTRASDNPTGGETGDGTENAVNNESKVHNLSLFFYKDVDASSIESTSTGALLNRIDVDESLITPSTSTTWTTQPIEVKTLTPGTLYHVVVVANPDAGMASITTLGQLQNYIQKQAWTTGATISDYDRFVMTSAFSTSNDDTPFKITSANTKSAPKNIAVNVRRLAARVDIIPCTSTNSATYNTAGYYEYPVVGTTSDKVRLTDVKLVNQMSAGTYLLKHLAAASGPGISTTTALIGTENPDAGVETNYVVDPWTMSKTAGATTMKATDGTQQAISTFYNTYYNTAAPTNTWTSDQIKQCSKDAYYTLGYTMENTMAKNCQLTEYTTGLSLRATYVPHSWYVLTGGVLTESSSVTPGTTFYTFDSKFYGSVEALTKAVNDKNGTAVDQATALATTGVKTYTNGVCYYNYWIRHSNNNQSSSGIMEFAIVRNNIYRIAFNSFSGIGTTTPDVDNHNDEGNVYVSIYVIPWSVYTHSIINL
jgi:hypothetical protein